MHKHALAVFVHKAVIFKGRAPQALVLQLLCVVQPLNNHQGPEANFHKPHSPINNIAQLVNQGYKHAGEAN